MVLIQFHQKLLEFLRNIETSEAYSAILMRFLPHNSHFFSITNGLQIDNNNNVYLSIYGLGLAQGSLRCLLS